MKYLAALSALLLSQAVGSLAQSCTSSVVVTAIGVPVTVPIPVNCPAGTVCCPVPSSGLSGSGGGISVSIGPLNICLTQAACDCLTSA
ncbi:hypothetical protein BD779DRAFT_323190 [Infundibulicybe gibba]|nr:hypothetical protein BD779DRAFT_323190 [Infundibulicybe gibba]